MNAISPILLHCKEMLLGSLHPRQTFEGTAHPPPVQNLETGGLRGLGRDTRVKNGIGRKHWRASSGAKTKVQVLVEVETVQLILLWHGASSGLICKPSSLESARSLSICHMSSPEAFTRNILRTEPSRTAS